MMRNSRIRTVFPRPPAMILAATVLLSWQPASAQITVAGPMSFDLTTSHLQAVQMQSSLISTSRIMQQQSAEQAACFETERRTEREKGRGPRNTESAQPNPPSSC